MSYDFTSDRITYASSPDFAVIGNLSAYFLVNLTSSASGLICTAEAGVGETENENSTLFLLIAGASNSWDIRYIHEFGNGDNEDETFLTNIANDTDTAIGLIRDVAANTVKMWKDGVLVSTFNYTSDPTIGATTSMPFHLGSRADGGFGGTFNESEVALWNAAIPEDIMVMLTKNKLCPNFYQKDGIFHSHLIRSAKDIWGAHEPTITGTAVASHPAVINPTQAISGFAAAAVPPAVTRRPVIIVEMMKYAPAPLLAGGLGLAWVINRRNKLIRDGRN